MLSIAQVFKNTHFLPHVNQFSQWMRCAIFQIKTNLLVIYQDINIFTKETLYPSIIWKKNWRSRLLAFFETSTFYHIFTVRFVTVRFVIFQINTNFLINQLQKYFHGRYLTLLLHYNKKIVFSIAQVFRNIHFLSHTN